MLTYVQGCTHSHKLVFKEDLKLEKYPSAFRISFTAICCDCRLLGAPSCGCGGYSSRNFNWRILHKHARLAMSAHSTFGMFVLPLN